MGPILLKKITLTNTNRPMVIFSSLKIKLTITKIALIPLLQIQLQVRNCIMKKTRRSQYNEHIDVTKLLCDDP